MPCYDRDFAAVAIDNSGLMREIIDRLGVDISGVCALEPVRRYIHASIAEDAGKMEFAISMGARLSDGIIEGIKDEPTLIYKHHYSTINHFLDQAALKLTSEIQKKGYKAIAIPASQIVDWDAQLGHLPHKAAAHHAGLGWVGRSNLLINPKFGARVRYVTILTDMPLQADGSVEGNCGECRRCIELCPAAAITEEGYDRGKCLAKLKEFSKKTGIGQYICGICVKACPGQA